MNSSYILKINFLSDIWFANIFSHSVGCQFILLTVSFAVQSFLVDIVPLVDLLLLLLVLLVSYPKIVLKTGVRKLFPMFFSKRCTVFQVSYNFFFLSKCWLCLVFIAAHGLSLLVGGWGCTRVPMRGLLISVALLVAEHGL